MWEKMTGFILFFLGIALMLYSTFQVFNLFTGKTKPPKVADFPGLSLGIIPPVKENLPPEISSFWEKSRPTEIMPKEAINQIADLVFYFFLMSFLLNVGFKLASLGILFLRSPK